MDPHKTSPHQNSDDDGNCDLPHHIIFMARRRLAGCLIGSFDRPQYRFNPGGHAAWEIPRPEPWNDIMSNDLSRPGIGQGAFQAITDFNSDLALLHRHQEQHAVVSSLLAKFPRCRYTMREFFKRLAGEGGEDQDSSLVACFRFMFCHSCQQRIHGRGRQHMGKIDDTACQRWDVEGLRVKG
jgi:hypothetical protein